jgi:CelD/BcsL family acetyltransferase involved in cellulose biosynthesis
VCLVTNRINLLSDPKDSDNASFAGVKTGCVDSMRALTQFEPEWQRLWAALPPASPFQSPDWLLPWWDHYGEGQLASFVFRHHGEVVGFAPLYIYYDQAQSSRKLLLLGTGNTDYLDVAIRPDFRDDCVAELAREVVKISDYWDRCEFLQLPATSALLMIVEEPNLHGTIGRDAACPVLPRSSSEALRAMLKRAAYYRRRLQRDYSFTIEQPTDDSLEYFCAALERLHQDRWQFKSTQGAFVLERDREFHHRIIRRFYYAKMLRMYALVAGGGIRAIFHGFAHRKHTYFYLSGFDPAFAHYSVGTIVLGHAIEDAFREGSEYFEFLRGEENYKYKWGARDEPTFRNVITKVA